MCLGNWQFFLSTNCLLFTNILQPSHYCNYRYFNRICLHGTVNWMCRKFRINGSNNTPKNTHSHKEIPPKHNATVTRRWGMVSLTQMCANQFCSHKITNHLYGYSCRQHRCDRKFQVSRFEDESSSRFASQWCCVTEVVDTATINADDITDSTNHTLAAHACHDVCHNILLSYKVSQVKFILWQMCCVYKSALNHKWQFYKVNDVIRIWNDISMS